MSAAAPPRQPVRPLPSRWRQRWRRLQPWLLGLFSLGLLAWLLWHLGQLDWRAAWQAARAMEASTLLVATAVALLGHLVYAHFDLLARSWLGLPLSRWRSLCSGAISYGFTLTLGSVVGGGGVRWRLLSGAGLGSGQITRVISLAVITNWMGYAAVAGVVLLWAGLQASAAPNAQALDVGGLQAQSGGVLPVGELSAFAGRLQHWLDGPWPLALGALLLLLALAWPWLLGWLGARQRRFAGPLTVQRRGRLQARLQARLQGRLKRLGLLPPWGGLAWLQVGLGALSWVCMAAVMGCLLNLQPGLSVPFGQVLLAQMLASLAGLIARVPGGLGVLELVYLLMLSRWVDPVTLMGALLVFRMTYFIAPLLYALPGYLWLSRGAPAPRAQ